MVRTKFTVISQNEQMFTYKGTKFMLSEKSQGVYGLGKGVFLYQMDGLKKEFIKVIGWTKTDNHGGPSPEVMLKGIVGLEECKTGALKYLQTILG